MREQGPPYRRIEWKIQRSRMEKPHHHPQWCQCDGITRKLRPHRRRRRFSWKTHCCSASSRIQLVTWVDHDCSRAVIAPASSRYYRWISAAASFPPSRRPFPQWKASQTSHKMSTGGRENPQWILFPNATTSTLKHYVG